MSDHALAAANLIERIGLLSRADEKVDDLYPAQWSALRYLKRANRFSGTPTALTRYLGTTRGTVSQTINALERKGYVQKKPGKEDRRSIDVILTPAGHRKLEDDPILRLAKNVEHALESGAPKLRQMLEDTLRVIVQTNAGYTFGQCHTCRHFLLNHNTSKKQPHRCALLDVPLSSDDGELICVEHELLET